MMRHLDLGEKLTGSATAPVIMMILVRLRWRFYAGGFPLLKCGSPKRCAAGADGNSVRVYSEDAGCSYRVSSNQLAYAYEVGLAQPVKRSSKCSPALLMMLAVPPVIAPLKLKLVWILTA